MCLRAVRPQPHLAATTVLAPTATAATMAAEDPPASTSMQEREFLQCLEELQRTNPSEYEVIAKQILDRGVPGAAEPPTTGPSRAARRRRRRTRLSFGQAERKRYDALSELPLGWLVDFDKDSVFNNNMPGG